MTNEIEDLDKLKIQMEGLRERRRDLGMQIAAEDSCHKATLINKDISVITKTETELYWRILKFKP